MEDDMNYHTMKTFAKDKEQQLRKEADFHRSARHVKSGQYSSGESNTTRIVAAAIIAIVTVAAAITALP